jgi:predicted RNA-binding Zn ribbon-like protein
MSKRQDAPGELELVRLYVNTLDVETGEDALERPERLAEWLKARGLASGGALRATRVDHRNAIALREALREILLSHTEGAPAPEAAYRMLDESAARARLSVRFDECGEARVEPAAGGVDAALGRLLKIVHAAIAEGTWTRLKACREHTCEWAFYDHTKNRSGTWCTMQVCGNRTKARAYRERRAEAPA